MTTRSLICSGYSIRKTSTFLKTASNFQSIKAEIVGAKKSVGVVTLNRPKSLNALCTQLLEELSQILGDFEKNKNVGAVVITGGEKAFAAGADVNEMLHKKFSDGIHDKILTNFDDLAKFKKPLIAAVNGYALGGGCVLVMMCDVVYAGNTAKFALPEILLGTIPGAGGTQRLIRSVGKSKAMEMVLTGNHVNAAEAEKMGLISKVFPPEQVLDEAIRTAEKISCFPEITTQAAKEALNSAYETTLQQGLRIERQLLHNLLLAKIR